MADSDPTIENLLQSPGAEKIISSVLPNILGDIKMADTSTDMAGLLALTQKSGTDDSMGKYLGLAIAAKALGFGVNDAAAAGLAAKTLSASDVQSIVNASTLQQTTGNIQGEIWKAEGNVQTAISASAAAQQIINLQGQIATLQAVDAAGDSVSGDVAGVLTAVTLGNTNNANLVNQLNTNLLTGLNSVEKTIVADGTATRAVITDLITDLNTANLNRQIVVADNRITELLGDKNTATSGINITTQVNQAQAQAQQQQQQIVANNLLTQLVGLIQHNTQSVVNLGTMIGSGQTATNVSA
jgi:hypothetical protein